MSNDTAERGWQELHARIEQMHLKYLSGEVRRIEYKPGDALHLLEMPSMHREGYPERK